MECTLSAVAPVTCAKVCTKLEDPQVVEHTLEATRQAISNVTARCTARSTARCTARCTALFQVDHCHITMFTTHLQTVSTQPPKLFSYISDSPGTLIKLAAQHTPTHQQTYSRLLPAVGVAAKRFGQHAVSRTPCASGQHKRQ
jgi:hypothetical protein